MKLININASCVLFNKELVQIIPRGIIPIKSEIMAIHQAIFFFFKIKKPRRQKAKVKIHRMGNIGIIKTIKKMNPTQALCGA